MNLEDVFYSKLYFMRTVTIEIINEKALNLLQNLEQLQLIRVHEDQPEPVNIPNWAKFKGLMTKQPLNEIDQQLDELRSEWE